MSCILQPQHPNRNRRYNLCAPVDSTLNIESHDKSPKASGADSDRGLIESIDFISPLPAHARNACLMLIDLLDIGRPDGESLKEELRSREDRPD